MLDLEKLSEYTKAVLAIVIGEHVIKMLPKDEGFLHSRKTLDLCWKCIGLRYIDYIWTKVDFCFLKRGLLIPEFE